MSILKSFCDIFKHKQTNDEPQKPTEAEQIHRLARLRAMEIVHEKRRVFLRFGFPFRYGSKFENSIMEDIDDVYDQAYNEVWNDFHR
jgi:hypothetical protein